MRLSSGYARQSSHNIISIPNIKMHFQLTTITALAALTSALPTLKIRQSGPVLASTTYDAISISGGQAGNAEAEALAVFSALDLNNPGNIDRADIEFLDQVNGVANDAETGAFNPAIEAATGAKKDALAAGKTKNKVLKLMATKIQLEAKQAQGEDVAAKLEEELTKLNNNIATDTKNAGKASTALPFDADITGAGAATAGAGAGNRAAVGNNKNTNQNGAAADVNADDDSAIDDNVNDDDAQDDAALDDDTQDQDNTNAGNNNAGSNGGNTKGNFLFGGN
ncbi:hypothetical protein N0V86_005001 [Didymella sp. IMI 355093]|nr:hypothetical protein N0V86_005001 [Didymella sp. IMI 355093]